MITCVTFDLDDTLYDEVEYCRSGFASVAEFLADLPDYPSAQRIFSCLWQHFGGGNRTKTFNAALDELGLTYDDTLIPELIEIYRGHAPNISLPDDSKEILCQLGGKYKLALLTDGFLPAQRLKVQALGLEEYFQCIIYTEELGRECWKPSPAGFEKLIETVKVKPENIAYVADNEKKDFIAPNQLGFLTIQIIRPARIHADSAQEPAAAAQYVIHRISELPALLEQL